MPALFAATLGEIVAALGGELTGAREPDRQTRVDRIGSLADADSSTLTFLANPRLASQLVTCAAACVIVAPAHRDAAERRGPTIVVADPYLYYARLTQWWADRTRPSRAVGVHPTAIVAPDARIAASALIGALSVVESGAVIDDDVTIGAQCFVGRDTAIGAGTRFAARVTFNERCRIGRRCTVHSGVVIGADGFGFAPTDGRWEKIEQLGGVEIGDDVDIGANTCIDRGALGDTVIEDGVKLDNLIQVGHNTRIGAHSALAGCVGIAGSATIGKHVMIGGAAMIGGHLEIADHVVISGGSTVPSSVREPGTYTSIFPLDEHRAWEKNAVVVRHLGGLRARVKALERTLAALTDQNADKNANETGTTGAA